MCAWSQSGNSWHEVMQCMAKAEVEVGIHDMWSCNLWPETKWKFHDTWSWNVWSEPKWKFSWVKVKVVWIDVSMMKNTVETITLDSNRCLERNWNQLNVSVDNCSRISCYNKWVMSRITTKSEKTQFYRGLSINRHTGEFENYLAKILPKCCQIFAREVWRLSSEFPSSCLVDIFVHCLWELSL